MRMRIHNTAEKGSNLALIESYLTKNALKFLLMPFRSRFRVKQPFYVGFALFRPFTLFLDFRLSSYQTAYRFRHPSRTRPA